MDSFANQPNGQEPNQGGEPAEDPLRDEPQQEQKGFLQNTTPTFILDCFSLVTGFLEKYGWFVVFGLIVVAFLWYKLRPHWMKLLKKWEEQQEIVNYDPDKAAELQLKIDGSRTRWQEIQDAKAARYAEEKKKMEEVKRNEMIEDWDRHQQGKGYRSRKFKAEDDSSLAQNVLKPKKKKPDNPSSSSDYGPLSGGGGGGSSYRPQRRGAGGGGG